MFCPKCGTQNNDAAKYCKNCGNALKSQQPVPAAKSQLPGVACHYPGCAEPVVGQCPGYGGSCLRYYCATHSIEGYCSVCVDKILRDAAVQAMYEDYLNAAQKVPRALGWGWTIILLPFVALVSAILGSAMFTTGSGYYAQTNDAAFLIFIATAVGLTLLSVWSAHRTKHKAVARIAAEKPGFKEFFDEYEKQKASENMASILAGLLVAGAAANAIQNYQMRQDIHEIAKRMRS